MPAATEIVANKPLAGTELQQIILQDVEKALAEDCMLSGQIAYGRVSYDVRVTLHLDNPSNPRHLIRMAAKKIPADQHDKQPARIPIEGQPPLAEARRTSIVSATETHRDIPSPNAARIEAGLPLTTTRKEQGKFVEEKIHYEKDTLDDLDPTLRSVATTRDVSAAARAELGLDPADVAKPVASVPSDPPEAIDGLCACAAPKPDGNGFCTACGGQLDPDAD